MFGEICLKYRKQGTNNIKKFQNVITFCYFFLEHFGYALPRFAKHLKTWDEAGTVKLEKVNKVDNYGVTCFFVGYANNHKGICYRM